MAHADAFGENDKHTHKTIACFFRWNSENSSSESRTKPKARATKFQVSN